MNRFSRAAHTYDQHAEAQRHFSRLLLQQLVSLPSPKHLLDVGCGTGILTELLAERFPRATIEAIDIAPAMVEAGRCKSLPHVSWHQADALTYSSPQPFNLIAANATFQWLHPIEEAISHFAQLLAPEGHLAFSVMTAGTLAELHCLRKELHPAKAPTEELRPFEIYRDALRQFGFTLVNAASSTYRVWHPSAPDFFRAISEQGVTGGKVSQSARGLLSRNELKMLIRAYGDRYQRPDGAVPATYESGIFLARRTS